MPRKKNPNSGGYIKPDYHSNNNKKKQNVNNAPGKKKKVKLRTSLDIYNRLMHDRTLGIDLNNVYIAYIDNKRQEIVELQISKWRMIEKGGDVPMHCIVYFVLALSNTQSIRIWDRESRLDRLFCSGNTVKEQSIRFVLNPVQNEKVKTKKETKKKIQTPEKIKRKQTKINKKTVRNEEKQNESNTSQRFKYLVVLDFEATCQKSGRISPQEIIEWPAIIIDTTTFEILESNSSSNNSGRVGHESTGTFPRPLAYHHPFYHNAGIMISSHNNKAHEKTPLKTPYSMEISRISQEIQISLQGAPLWNILFGDFYSFLLIGSIVVCNFSVYGLLIISNIAMNENLFSFKWQCGLLYIPMQFILFIFYPLIITWCKQNNSSSPQNKVYLLIVGLFLLSLSIACIGLIDKLYLLFIIVSIQGLALAFIFGAFTQIMDNMMQKSRNKNRKPVLSILTIANRFGFVLGSLIGGKLSEYFNQEQTFLILAAVVLLYSPFLILLLRETNHKNVLFEIEQESSEYESDTDDDEDKSKQIVQMVDSSDSSDSMIK